MMSSFTDGLRRRLGEETAPAYDSLVSGRPPGPSSRDGGRSRPTAAGTHAMGSEERIFLYCLMAALAILAVANPLLVDGNANSHGLMGMVQTLLTFPFPWIQCVVMALSGVCIAVLAVTTQGFSRVEAGQRTALTAARWGGIVGGVPTALVLATMVLFAALVVGFLMWLFVASSEG